MDRMRELIQGALALVTVGGALGITLILVLEGRPISELPNWLALMIGAVAGFYYGAASVASGVSKGSNGVVQAARQIVQSVTPEAAAATSTKQEEPKS